MEDKDIAVPVSIASTRAISLSLTFSAVAFALPFTMTHPQLLLGTFVNALLILSAAFLPLSLAVPVAVMPSLAVLSRGVLFGGLTPFLYYILPLIWIGNLTFIFFFKKLGGKNYFLALFWASAAKMTVLFLPVFLLVNAKLLPSLFLTTMGAFQFYTALGGGILVFALSRFYKKISF